jgi:hypothetical protein
MPADTPDILDLLIQHERALARLYLRFAAVFGERQELWQKLAGEEHSHAKKLEALLTEPERERWLSRVEWLKREAILSSIGHADMQASRAAEGGLTLLQALAVANDLEDALIDRQFISPIPSDCGGIGVILEELRKETEEHRRVLREALEAGRRARR